MKLRTNDGDEYAIEYEDFFGELYGAIGVFLENGNGYEDYEIYYILNKLLNDLKHNKDELLQGCDEKSVLEDYFDIEIEKYGGTII